MDKTGQNWTKLDRASGLSSLPNPLFYRPFLATIGETGQNRKKARCPDFSLLSDGSAKRLMLAQRHVQAAGRSSKVIKSNEK
jgi:hypothetical protein